MSQTFYQDYSALIDPDLARHAKMIACLTPDVIETILSSPTMELSEPISGILCQHAWATAKRALCYRTTEDDPNVWRNATPPDREPIIVTFKMTEAAQTGFKFEASPAADYRHFMKYRYIGFNTDSLSAFMLNTVTRQHKKNKADQTVGHELVLIRSEKLISLYLGNDGKSPDLPPEYREVRVMTDLKTAYKQVIQDIDGHMKKIEPDDTKRLVALRNDRTNYQHRFNVLQAK